MAKGIERGDVVAVEGHHRRRTTPATRPDEPRSATPPPHFIGPLPPPVDGQAVVTEFLLHALQRRGIAPAVVDIGPGGRHGWRALVRRMTGFGEAVRRLAADIPWRRRRLTYLSLNANRGMLVTAGMAALAQAAGHRIIIHHHTSAHLERRWWTMVAVCLAAGRDAVHVCICEVMSARLRALYGGRVHDVRLLSNIVTVSAAGAVAGRSADDTIVLGHLSNLSFDKGLARAIETLRALRERNLAARLVLAGPCRSREIEAYVAASLGELAPHLEYRGPIYGDDKPAFFADIDVFVFPTSYANETQGIVNLEALAHGVPVVAYARCCISEDIDADAGLAVPLDAEFAAHAAAWIAAACGEPAARLERGARARARFETLHRAAAAELDRLLARLDGTAPPG